MNVILSELTTALQNTITDRQVADDEAGGSLVMVSSQAYPRSVFETSRTVTKIYYKAANFIHCLLQVLR